MEKNSKEIQNYIKHISTELLNSRRSDYYCFGVNYFGPFLYGYTSWLWEKVNKFPVHKVFFFSRDGFMMTKAFDFFNRDEKIRTEYVFFSRRSIRQALLWRCDSYIDSLKYLTEEKYVSIGKLLEYYGFSYEEKKYLAELKNFNLDEDLEYSQLHSNKSIKELYEELKGRILELSKEQDFLLSTYLKQIDFQGECAIVDIGWHGNMQYYLEEFSVLHNLNVKIHGYYVGISPTVPIRGITDGYLYNQNDLSLRKSILCFLGGYEKLFQSCEGSTKGYNLTDGIVKPTLGEYEYQNKNEIITCIGDWQNGAIEFINMLIKDKYIVEDLKSWAYPLVNFGKNPPMFGVKLFSFFYNTDGSKEYYVSQKSLLKYKPKEFIHALSNSVWKTGFMKSVFKLPLPYYYVYRMIRK